MVKLTARVRIAVHPVIARDNGVLLVSVV